MPIPRLFFILTLALLSGLTACKPYEDLRGPVSGVKVAKPLNLFIVPADTVVFSGVCLDESGLTSIRYGMQTNHFPWEGTNNDTLANVVWDSVLAGTLQNFEDTVYLKSISSKWPQGRMLCYSIVKNLDGNNSDTNKAYKYFRNFNYPFLELTRPAANANFSLFRAGDTVQITGRAIMEGHPDDTIAVTSQPCLLYTDGTLDCSGQRITLLKEFIVPDSDVLDSTFTGRIEMPISAQAGQLYRLKISAKSQATGRQTYLAPGFQLRAQ